MSKHFVSKKENWVPGAAPFFLFGFFYYIVSPAFVLEFLSEGNDLLYAATRYADSSYFNTSYFLDALIILVSFFLGYFLAKGCIKAKSSVLDYGSFQASSPLLLATSFFVLIVYFGVAAGAAGVGFFTGYTTYDILVLGPFATCAFMSAWFVNYFSDKQVSLIFLSFFVICGVLLLGWGSRMFFVVSLMALMIGLLSKNKKLLKSLWVYGFVFILGFFMVAVGILREGGGDFSGDKLIAVFFAEPLFTSITGAIYLENTGGRPVYSIPYDLFASVINFIPSAVYPGKIEHIGEITHNELIYAPFGAKALLLSLYHNFGYFYPIYVAFIGFYYGFLYKKAQYSVFYRATYFSALPILMLHFQREGLVSAIKIMFFNGLALPAFIALVLIWLSPRKITDIRRRMSHSRVRRGSA